MSVELPDGQIVNLPGGSNVGEKSAVERAIIALASNLVAMSATLAAVKPQQTFADADARDEAIPAFVGQLGVQIDTETLYIGTDTVAGSWSIYPAP